MGFDFVLSGRFVVGLVVGILLYHVMQMRAAKKSG